MTVNLNQVALTGNLTRDPQLIELPSGHVYCELQLACHHRSRDEVTGAWREWPDYYTIKAFGHQARTTHRHLRRGHGVGITGRLSSRRVCEHGRPIRHDVEVIAEGGREHTGYAHEVTFALARDLASAGVTILSGLHQGIDGIAQHGAMHANGNSIAVTGCGPDRPYPRQLEHPHRRLRARGAILSELGPGHYPPRRWTLLASQRLIAGIADVVVVIEAPERSSALLAAQLAADLGHDVAAIPGRITDRGARGTFELLRDGAHPVGSAQDVLELVESLVAS